MTAFHDHRRAALHLIATAEFTPKEGGFFGQMAFSDVMSDRQARWLAILLERHGLPPLAVTNGAAA